MRIRRLAWLPLAVVFACSRPVAPTPWEGLSVNGYVDVLATRYPQAGVAAVMPPLPGTPLEARLGPRFTEGTLLKVHGGECRFLPEGARDAALEEKGGAHGLYRDVWPSTDVVQQVEGGRVKEALVLRDARSPRRFSFRAETELRAVRVGGGNWSLVDGAGETRLVVERPFVVDAKGKRVDLDWVVEGKRWSVEVPEGLAYPAVLDPTAGVPVWTNRNHGSGARQGAAMAWAGGSLNQLLIFGGASDEAGSTLVQNTQVYNVSTGWAAPAAVGTQPSARRGHAMATLTNGSVALFGGINATDEQNDFHVFTPGTGWSARTVTGTLPNIRQGATMVALSDTVVLVHGGVDETLPSHYNDSFEITITGATTATSANVSGTLPDAHAGHGMILTSATTVLVFGGEEPGGLSQDTWVGTKAAGVWNFAAASLTQPPPSARRQMSFVSYPSFAANQGILFGGVGAGGVLLNDTWRWTGTEWNQLIADGAPASPAARRYHAAAFDPVRRRLIVAGGKGSGATPLSDTWEFRHNNRPDITVPGAQTGAENSTISFTVTAQDTLDADDTVTLSLVSMVDSNGNPPFSQPTLSTIFPNATATNSAVATRDFSWQPGFRDAGVYTLTFRAADGVEVTAPTATVQLTVTNTNRPPTITLNPNDATIEAFENDAITFTATIADLDADDTLSFTNDTPPTGATVTNTSTTVKTFNWTPGFTQGALTPGAAYSMQFTAQDGTATVNVPVSFAIRNRPSLGTSPAGPFTVAELSALNFTVQNAAGDGIALTLSNPGGVPTGASFTAGTGAFAWTPSCSQASSTPYAVTFRGTDANGTATDLLVSITVTGSIITLTPTTLPFGPSQVGVASAAQPFTLSNGGGALLVSNITSSSPGIFQLSGLPTMFPAALGAGGTLPFGVAFAPNLPTGFAGTITVTTNDAVCPTTTASVTGTGQTMTVAPLSIGFGDQRVAVASGPQTITLTNPSTTSFTVSQPTLTGTDFTLVNPLVTWPFTLAANNANNLQLTVRSQPQSLGAKSGTVNLTTNIPFSSPIGVVLTTVGVAPGIAIDRPSIDFGPIDRDAGPVNETVTVTNDGTFNLSVSQVRLTGPGIARYTITSAPAVPATITPGNSFNVTVAYDPIVESAGEPAAQLEILSNAQGEPSIILPITGRGADRHIALSSGTLDFPATRRNQVRELQVTVSNTGEAPLALSGFSFSGDGAAAYSTNQTATTVGPNDDLVVSVFFRPTAAAGFSASMTIINDDDGLPMARVDLGGVGTLAPLLVSPGAITANVVPVGVKRRLPNPIVVTNPEVESAEIDVVCIGLAGAEACDPASPFQVAEWTGPRTLAGQTDVTLEVDFEPEVAGLYQGRVLVFVDGDPQPLLFVTVEGQGIDDVVLSGGGCAVGGEGGGDWWIVAIGVLALLVRRRVAWLALLLFASVAHADPATSFDLGVFRPTVPTRASFITVEPPEIHAKGVFGAGLTFDYAKNPLLAQRAGSDMVDAPVSDRSELILGLTYALPRVQLTLEIPGMSQAGSVAFTGVDAADGTALGDLSLHARFELWRGSAVALAASAQVTLPTGDEDAYAGSDGLVMKGVGILGVRAGRLRMAGNLGVRVRTSSAVLGNIEQGQEMVFGAGLAVRLLRGLDAIGEVFGSTPLGGEGRLTPLEGLVGTRVWVTEQVAFSAGGGMGLTSGVGAPDARVFVGVAWFPTESSLKGGKKTVAFGGILDVDEDGIPDQVDRCVNEAEDKDKHQDEDGCPELDNDSDGVLDVADKCPNEAEDGDEFQDADGCPEFDNDGDKVVDARDQCPQNKEDLDGFRDEDGCLDPDNDADGLPDGIDQCPLEPEVVNGNADDDGCPDPGDSLVMVFPDKLELLAPIEFAGETANLKPTSRPVLEQVATTLRLSPSIKVRVASHVHRRGGQQADYNLSVKRGEAVKKFLVDRGVDAGRLEMKPFGSTKPLGSRDVNDRIVFELVK